MVMKQINFRHGVASLCCVVILFFLCSGCARETPTSPTSTTSSTSKKPDTKPAVLYRNAQEEVIAAEFMRTALSPKQIAALNEHANLKAITFYECQEFSDEVCDELAKLNGVNAIHFARCPIDDATLNELSKMPNIDRLTLTNSDVTSKGIASLNNWKNLKWLTLSGTIQPEAIDGLADLQQLESLEIAVNDFVARKLAEVKLPTIRTLRISFVEVSDDDLSALPAWKTLEEFEFPPNIITDHGIAHLKKFSSLKKLVLTGSQITDAGLAELLELKSLEILTLNGCKNVTNLGLQVLAQMPVLERLLLEDSGMTGAGLMHLAPSKSLRYIGIGAKQSTKAEAAKLAEAIPGCQVERIEQPG